MLKTVKFIETYILFSKKIYYFYLKKEKWLNYFESPFYTAMDY